MAVIEDKVDCAKLLLSHPGIDINIKNKRSNRAKMKAQKKTLAFLNLVEKTCNDFPVDSYGKVALCGNAGAGKSTLTQMS